jgi:cyclohexyl-isocyanide hydratase
MPNAPSNPLTILFPIYPGVTHLDFTGPQQFFARLPGVKTIVASVEGKPITSDGLSFCGLTALEQIDHCDVLCVPGGFGCIDAILETRYLSAIRALAQRSAPSRNTCNLTKTVLN